LVRNFKIAKVKLGTFCFTNKFPWKWYYKRRKCWTGKKRLLFLESVRTLLVLCC